MKLKTVGSCVLAVLLLVILGLSQTTTELLQRGIFAQETEGNLDSAIMIYRQIVNSASSQRDVAAQAQYRLAQALLQKGDLQNAAAEFQKLARDYADQQALVSRMAAEARGLRTARVEAGKGEGKGKARGPLARPGGEALAALSFDDNRPVVIRGKAVMVQFSNPAGLLMVESEVGDQTERYVFLTAAANQLIRQGFTRESIKPGQEVTVTGVLAANGGVLEEIETEVQGVKKLQRVYGARASTITLQDATIVFDRAKVQESTSAAK